MDKSVYGGTPLRICDLPVFRHSVHEDIIGKDVRTLFETHPDCPGVIVLGGKGKLHGMLSRQKFRDLLLTPYGADLYLKRSVGKMADSAPLILKSSLGLDEAAHMVLSRDSKHLSEPVVVEFDYRENG